MSNVQEIQKEVNEIKQIIGIKTKDDEKKKNEEQTVEIKYHYFNGRGYSEPSRVLLSALGLKFTQRFLKEPDELDELRSNGSLVYNQLPLVEFDGKKFVQQGAIIRYIARKYNVYGCNDDERYIIDVVYEGTRDAREPLTNYYRIRDVDKITFRDSRYFGAWEKLLTQNDKSMYFTSKVSFADIAVYEVMDYVEEIFGNSKCEELLKPYPKLRALRDDIGKMGRIPEYKKERNPQPYDEYLKDVRNVFDNAKIDNIYVKK